MNFTSCSTAQKHLKLLNMKPKEMAAAFLKSRYKTFIIQAVASEVGALNKATWKNGMWNQNVVLA